MTRQAYYPEEIAELLPVDAAVVRRKCRTGEIRAAKWGGRLPSQNLAQAAIRSRRLAKASLRR